MEQISVIVPIYKVEAYLDKCVESLTSQTYRDLQIILVDDGSPDRCGAMCDTWAEKDRRIKVVHKENGGLSDARNAGLALATGALISFIDSDDWVEPDFLETLYAAMEANGAQIAECAIDYVDEQGTVLRQRGPAENAAIGKIEALRRLVLEDGVYQTVWNKLYRRDVIEGILFEKGKCNEDDFWTYQIFDRIEKLALATKPMYHYLQRGGSIMGTGYNPKRLDGLEARFRRMEYLQKYEALAALTRQQLVLDCMWHLQSVMRHLNGPVQEEAKAFIMKNIKAVPKVPQKKLSLNAKHRVWYAMFTAVPVLTVKFRNRLGIGS